MTAATFFHHRKTDTMFATLFSRALKLAAATALAGALTACAGSGDSIMSTGAPSVTGTGAPVGGGINVAAGSNEDFIVNVGRRLYFREGSAELSDEAKITVAKQAEWLSRYPQWKAKIEGFADEAGSAEFNRQIGMKRAEAVRTYLASQGIPAGRMRVKTFGNLKERMVNTCGDTSCRSQNRRVVTVLEQAGV
jgi:peptidoglycan-associated lipoprotein